MKKLEVILRNLPAAIMLVGITYFTGGCIMPDHKNCHHPPANGRPCLYHSHSLSSDNGPRAHHYPANHAPLDHGTAIPAGDSLFRIKLF